MIVESPRWQLLHVCAVCGQGSALTLVACPSCAHVAVVCDEEGSGFPAPRETLASDDAVDQASTACRGCGVRLLSDFAPATASQIRAAGYEVGEYR